MKRQNIGERAETFAIATLYHLQVSTDPIDRQVLVTLLGDDALGGIILYTTQGVEITSPYQIRKAPSGFKADIILEFVSTGLQAKISIKSRDGARCSILNTTRRSASVFQPGGYMHTRLPALDRIIRSMNERKTIKSQNPTVKYSGGYTEDQATCDMQITTRAMRDSILHLIRYFTFLGAGKCDSILPADSILTVRGIDPSGWVFTYVGPTEAAQIAYAESIYNSVIISIRNPSRQKNVMTPVAAPTNLTDKKTARKYDAYLSEMKVCGPWIYKNKGSINIRLAKSR